MNVDLQTDSLRFGQLNVVRRTPIFGTTDIALRLPLDDFARHPEAVAAFQSEFSIGQAVRHPNTDGALACGVDSQRETPYLVVRLVPGETLAERLMRTSPEPVEREFAWSVASQAGAALTHVHDSGFVHSDVKPYNLFIETDGTVRLQNFAIARPYTADRASGGFDAGELGALTPNYASLEMFEGMDPDPRDDVYGFGVVLYQLFAGCHPFDRVSAPKAEEAKLRPPRIKSMSRTQNRALRQAVAFRASTRTPTVSAVITALERQPSFVERLFG